MRYQRSTALLILLFCTACFEIADFGDFWARGRVDSDVAGTWVEAKEGKGGVVITADSNILRIQMLDDDGKTETPEKDLYGRTIDHSGQRFLMAVSADDHSARSPGGTLYPYTLTADRLTAYNITKAGGEFLQQKLGHATVTVEQGMFYSVKVTRLSAACLSALLPMIGDERYFSPMVMKRLKKPAPITSD